MRRLFLLLALAFPLASQAAPLKALSPNDVPSLLHAPAKGVRVLAFWALDCAYCESNLQALNALHLKHPEVEVITIATDHVSESAAIAARLRSAQVSALPAYAYAESSPERINFLIDPNWGGETPRTLILRSDGSRQGISGALSKQALAAIP